MGSTPIHHFPPSTIPSPPPTLPYRREAGAGSAVEYPLGACYAYASPSIPPSLQSGHGILYPHINSTEHDFAAEGSLFQSTARLPLSSPIYYSPRSNVFIGPSVTVSPSPSGPSGPFVCTAWHASGGNVRHTVISIWYAVADIAALSVGRCDE